MSSNGTVKSLLSTVNEQLQEPEEEMQATEVVSDSDIPDEVAAELEEYSKQYSGNSESGKRKHSYLGELSKRYTAEDVENKNPQLYKKLYLVFNQLELAGNKKGLTQLINDYLKWYEEFKAEQERVEREKQLAKAQRLAESLKGLTAEQKKQILLELQQSA